MYHVKTNQKKTGRAILISKLIPENKKLNGEKKGY